MKKFVVLMIVTFGLIVSIFAVFALNRWYPTHGHADWDEVQQFTADKIPVNPKDFRVISKRYSNRSKRNTHILLRNTSTLIRFTPHAFNELTPCNRKWLIHYL